MCKLKIYTVRRRRISTSQRRQLLAQNFVLHVSGGEFFICLIHIGLVCVVATIEVPRKHGIHGDVFASWELDEVVVHVDGDL